MSIEQVLSNIKAIRTNYHEPYLTDNEREMAEMWDIIIELLEERIETYHETMRADFGEVELRGLDKIDGDDVGEIKLNMPLTKEDWAIIADYELEHTDEITFRTPKGKEVVFTKKKEEITPLRKYIDVDDRPIGGFHDD